MKSQKIMWIYNSLTEKKEKLAKKKDELKMFVCGPTVYDYSHIGHARTYLIFDLLTKFLRCSGYKVFYLQNITDIDDRIIERAQRDGKDSKEIAKIFEKEYLKDMSALGIDSVGQYARASDHIEEIKKQISKLGESKFTYKTRLGIYFRVKKFKDYGKLSRQDLEALRPGWRIEPDPQKEDPLDFALWKFSKSDQEPSWNSPWGKGRPGWHIEDTAITEKFFGPQYDLHGGGVDLKFPHHESEIAQQEAASGKKPFVKIWMHTGFLLVDNQKMSKSLGNFITIRDFLSKHHANVLKFVFLNTHYRSPLNYADHIAEQSEAALEKINKFLNTITLKKDQPAAWLKKFDKEFTAALEDDFSTPKSLAVIFDFLAKAPKTEKSKTWLVDKLNVLGIDLKQPRVSPGAKTLLSKRELLRKKGNFAEADKIREQLNKLGLEVED